LSIMNKKLYRSDENKIFAGVCGGIGEHTDIDPVIIRLIWVLLSLFAGLGLLGLIAYLIAVLIIPAKPEKK